MQPKAQQRLLNPQAMIQHCAINAGPAYFSSDALLYTDIELGGPGANLAPT